RYRNVAFYRNSFDTHNINVEKIKSLKDIRELPFTTKDDLIRSYPYDMFAVPLRDIVRIHSSSGTTGKPIAVGYTANDIKHWSILVARLLTAGGITRQDFVQIALNYNLFTGGLAYHYGAELIGASVIPSSTTGDIEKQIAFMKDFKTTALISTPSYALSIADALENLKIHPEQLHLKYGLFCAEPWSESMRSRIQEKLHLVATDNYGITEILGAGVAGECQERNGMHINEDHFIVEVIDPHTLQPLLPGEEGELVFTTLTKEGFPLIRYRTGDMASLIDDRCPCGRTLMRMSRVTGRCDDIILVNGTKLYPTQIDEIFLKLTGRIPRYVLVVERENEKDAIEIMVEIAGIDALDEMKNVLNYRDRLQHAFETASGVSTKVLLVESETILKMESRSKIIDRRGK
ncbi:MAG: phenylacetate--CoA ligase, partial [Spirochaetes bacterium]|nr:phenylacetate--CoA ligase [Spirochaetota bacterium]